MRRQVVVILVILAIGVLLAWLYLEWVSQPAPPLPLGPPIEVPKAPPPGLKIGAVLPLSGARATEGAEAKAGLEVALARAKAEHGLEARLLIEDDKGESSEAENLIHILAMRENVLAIITGAVKDEARPSHLAQELRVPILLLKEGDEALLGGSSYLFGLGLAAEDEAAVLAHFAARELGLTYAGILVDVKDASLRSAAAAARRAFETAGGQVVSQVSCVSGDEDFSGQINRIKTRGAQVLFALAGANEGAKIISQARERGFEVPILATSRFSGPAIIGLERKVLGDCFITCYLSLEEKREAFVSLQESLGEAEVSDTVALAYDAFSLLAQALTQVPQPTRDTLVQALGAIKDFPGATGTLSFKGTGAILRDIAVRQIGGEVRSRILPPFIPEEVPAPPEVESP